MNETRVCSIAALLIVAACLAAATAMACTASMSSIEPSPLDPTLSPSRTSSPTPIPEPDFLGSIEPCIQPAECEPRPILPSIFGPLEVSAAMYGGYDAPTTEEVIEKGLYVVGASPTHIAFRGAARDDVECIWRGVARTRVQRDEAVRYWLGMDENDEIPSRVQLEATFEAHIEEMEAVRRPDMRANFMPLARGGTSSEGQFLLCYVHYDTHEYILGGGKQVVTVAYDQLWETRSYEL